MWVRYAVNSYYECWQLESNDTVCIAHIKQPYMTMLPGWYCTSNIIAVMDSHPWVELEGCQSLEEAGARTIVMKELGLC